MTKVKSDILKPPRLLGNKFEPDKLCVAKFTDREALAAFTNQDHLGPLNTWIERQDGIQEEERG